MSLSNSERLRVHDLANQEFEKNSILALEKEARARGVLDTDIFLSRKSGFSPLDIRTFKQFTLTYPYLFVFRCPKLSARAWMKLGRPKPCDIKLKKDVPKTDVHGVIYDIEGDMYFSDYDMMCAYKFVDRKTEEKKKIAFSWDNAEATDDRDDLQIAIAALNQTLQSEIQHGAQDDWKSSKNRGVIMSDDTYVCIKNGQFYILGDGKATRGYYKRHGLQWVYDENGHYVVP